MLEATTESPQSNKSEFRRKAFGGIQAESAEEQTVFSPVNKESLWQGPLGLILMTVGVLSPSLLLLAAAISLFERLYHLVLRFPVETLVEFSLLALVPIANYQCWKALRKSDCKKNSKLFFLNGIAIGASTLASGAFSYPLLIDKRLLMAAPEALTACLTAGALVSLPCLAVSVYLASQLIKSWATDSARLKSATISSLGALLSISIVAACEYRPVLIRHSEQMALGGDPLSKAKGLSVLRSMNVERELRLICGDPKAGGFAGVFFPVDPSKERQLYFQVTGKPYRNNLNSELSSLADEDLFRHAVGEKVPGLSMMRSTISGTLHPDTLSSSIDWTVVFDNSTWNSHPIRAAISLPQNAVVSGLTYWVNGAPRKATIGTTNTNLSGKNFTWLNSSSDDPAVLTDLGNGRVLLTCNNVPSQSEIKVQVKMVSPMKLETLKEASLLLPQLVASNFSLSEGENTLRLQSPNSQMNDLQIRGLSKNLLHRGPNSLSGRLSAKDLRESGLLILAKRNEKKLTSFAKDPFADSAHFITQTIATLKSPSPSKIVLVVDGSAELGSHLSELKEALSQIPSNIESSLILASSEKSEQPQALGKALKELDAKSFVGGQDNLRALMAGAQMAGESKNGALLWIHGPQSHYNKEIYIMAPYFSAPNFYECAIGSSFADTREFLKNHQELGPFSTLPRSNSLKDDLKSFVCRWQQGSMKYSNQWERTSSEPKGKALEREQALELAILAANEEFKHLYSRGQIEKAAKIAVRYGIVTAQTAAIVFGHENQMVNDASGPRDNQDNYEDITSSKIEKTEEESDKDRSTTAINAYGNTLLMGINTSGAVRVNNLANLESLLNIFANGVELGGILFAIANLVYGLMGRSMKFPLQLGPKARIAFGVAVGLVALAVPGLLNWFVASARDANLFS